MSVGGVTSARKPRGRQTPRRSWTISYSPDVLAAFLAMLGLGFITYLGALGALLFLGPGMALVVRRPGETLAALRREWFMVLVALWCVMSFAWSDYTSLTLRYGIQFGLTVMIGVVISYRLAPITFVKIVMATSSLAGVASLLSGRTRGDGMGYLGIYASKNELAGAMAILIIVALAVLVDRRMAVRWRLPALLSLVLGAVLMVMGKSSGALVSTLGVIAAFGIILLLQRLTPYVRLVAIAATLVLFAAVAVLLSSITDELAKTFLDITGKDITLTGRTDLWRVAFQQIAERPFLGVGFQAFWVHGQPLAEQLWAQFGIASRRGFNFHNTPISNTVEVGLIGTALQMIVFLGALWSCLVWVVRSPSAMSVFFALFMVRLFLLMWVEAIFFYQFETVTVIMVAAIRYGKQFRDSQCAKASHIPRRRGKPGPPAVIPTATARFKK